MIVQYFTHPKSSMVKWYFLDHGRFSTFAQVTFSGIGGIPNTQEVIDLSLGGAWLATGNPMEIGGVWLGNSSILMLDFPARFDYWRVESLKSRKIRGLMSKEDLAN